MSFWKKAFVTSALTLSCLTAAFSTKLSYAYFANAVSDNNSSATGDLVTGTWRDYNLGGTAISTAAQFNVMLNSNNSNIYHLINSIDFNNASLTAGNFTFSGKFYGNGFTLSNLVVPKAHKGIFFAVSGATIQNVILNNVDVATSASRATAPAGILVGTNSGDNTNISKIRLIGSTLYTSGTSGTGGIVGTSTKIINISNVSIESTIINGSSSSIGGIIGTLSNAATINDIYVEATIQGTSYVGGLYGTLANGATANTISRIVVYSTITATTNYSAGIVGYNSSNKAHVITDFIFSGQLNSPSNRAGTINNNLVMSNTNGWAAQWSSTNIAVYTNMTGYSVSYTTRYLALRTSLTLSWWSTNLNSIASNPDIWAYNSSTYLYKPVSIA